MTKTSKSIDNQYGDFVLTYKCTFFYLHKIKKYSFSLYWYVNKIKYFLFVKKQFKRMLFKILKNSNLKKETWHR